MLAGCSLFAEITCSSRIRRRKYRHWWHRHSQYRHRRSDQPLAPPTKRCLWCLYVLEWPLQTWVPVLVYGHFDTKTLRHQDTSAPVPKCPSDTWISAPVPKCLGYFGTDHRSSHACQRRQLRSGRGGELKAVDVYVPLSLNCGFWSQLSSATVRSQLLWKMLRVIIITVMV